jgi:outer membrane protein assembly factor BamB
LAASQDTVFLAAGTQVYAIDLNTGSEKWRYPVKPNAKGFYANPVLTPDGQLLVPSYDNKLYSLNPATGSENWSFTGSKNRLIASPLVIQTMIYQPSADGHLYALDMTGKQVWAHETGGPLWAQPSSAPDCGCIFVASMDHTVYSFNATTGEQLWRSEDLGGALVGTPAVGADGILYIGTFGHEMVALDAQTGAIRWRFTTDGSVWSGPALANNFLYFGDMTGYFYALNAADGSLLWRIQPNNTILDTPLVLADKIYFATEADTLYTVSTAGDIVHSKVIGGTLYGAPILAGETMLVAPLNSDVLLVALTSAGDQKWTFTPAKK